MIRKETFEVMHKQCDDYVRRGEFCAADPEKGMPLCSYENCPIVETSRIGKATYEEQFLNPEEFADKMLDIFKEYYLEKDDEEDTHWEMDVAIMDLLCALGYEEAVWIFKNTPRWYA